METPPDDNDINSLESIEIETPSNSAETYSSGPQIAPAPAPAPETSAAPTPPEDPKRGLSERLRSIIGRLNVYMLAFFLIIVIAVAIVLISASRDRKAADITLGSVPLTTEQLQEIGETEASVGDPKQTLTIESNSVFSGRVLVRDDLDVAGTIRVGGALNLPGITVSGRSAFDEITANDLSVSGNTSLQGQLNVQQNLQVSGSASFGGTVSAPQLNIESLQLDNDLQLNRHIDAGGGTPSKTNGSALGNGGTSSVSGTDTAGTITINTGGSPAAGCFITVVFARAFNGTPHVVATPVGSRGASLNYYVTRDASSFRLCSTNAASPGASFSFDYIVID